ncbi:hypothetical protein [Kitasatospora sp. NPDC059571]|uniref:hypothetical protein n=1 Tax=Kitasatospora sp. NPDC059571 TaxID=3346871 RepID=UPI0036768F3D
MLQHLITQGHELRMVPTDHNRLAEAVEELCEELRALPEGTETDRQRMLTRWVGIGLMTTGHCRGACEFLQQSLALAAAGGNTRAVISTELNLGDAHRYAGDVETADGLYRKALGAARTQQPELVDFALQHFAKHLMEKGDLAAARDHLLEARHLRIAKGDTDLMESTQAALDRVELLITQSGAAAGVADLEATQ